MSAITPNPSVCFASSLRGTLNALILMVHTAETHIWRRVHISSDTRLAYWLGENHASAQTKGSVVRW